MTKEASSTDGNGCSPMLTYFDERMKCSQKSWSILVQFALSLTQDASATDVLDKVVARRVTIMPCPMCAAPFESRQSLREHINGIHLRKKCFRCEACGESFMWRAQVWKHQRTPGKCRCAGAAPFEMPWTAMEQLGRAVLGCSPQSSGKLSSLVTTAFRFVSDSIRTLFGVRNTSCNYRRLSFDSILMVKGRSVKVARY